MRNPPSVLVVDDEFLIVAMLSDALEVFGYDVGGTAETAVDAVQLALQLRPDVVLMDVRLKGPETGIDAAARIRRSLDCPIIFITGSAEPDTVKAIAEVSPFALFKPINIGDLQGLLAKVLPTARAS